MSGAARSVTAANLSNYDSAWSLTQYGERVRGLFPAESALIDEFFPPAPASILDIGCGAGRTTTALAARHYAVVAIDLSTSLVERARATYPHLDFRIMDATALDFPDARFDAAIFSYNGIDVIHPVASRVRCLAEAYRVLRPGGVLLISSHNAIGAIFSGGYFYPRGYLNAVRWFVKQRGNALLGEWYWRYDDPGGPQHLYSAPPSRTVTQAGSVGFHVLAMRGSSGQGDPGVIARREQHVHFVLRKPA